MAWNRVLVSFEPDALTKRGIDLARLTAGVRDPDRDAHDVLPEDERPAVCVMALAAVGRPTLDSVPDLVRHAPEVVTAAAARLTELVMRRHARLIRDTARDHVRASLRDGLLRHCVVCDLTPLRRTAWANDNLSPEPFLAGDAVERAEAVWYVVMRAAQADGPLWAQGLRGRLALAHAEVAASCGAAASAGYADWVPGRPLLDRLVSRASRGPGTRRVPLLLRHVSRIPDGRASA